MLKGLTYRRKNRLLLLGAAVLLLLVYVSAVSKTVALRSTCSKLAQRIDSAARLPEETRQMEARLAALDKDFRPVAPIARVHEELLGTVSNRCQQLGLVLRDFPAEQESRHREWIVKTHVFTVEGGFNGLLQLVHELERMPDGKVLSADYRSRRDPKTRALSLSVTVYVQHLTKANDETRTD